MDQLLQRIEQQGFEKADDRDPEGDGDCFYKAAAFQLGRDGIGLKNEIFDFLKLNQYDQLGQNRLDYLCSYDIKHEDVPSDWNKALFLLRNNWANEMIIRALSESLHCRITIITTSGETPDSYVKVITPPEGGGTPLHELYFGHTGAHYFPLKKKIKSKKVKKGSDTVLPSWRNIQPKEEGNNGTMLKLTPPGYDEKSNVWIKPFSTLLNLMFPVEYLLGEIFWWQGLYKAKQLDPDHLWKRDPIAGSRAEGLFIPFSLLHENESENVLTSDVDVMIVKEPFERKGEEQIPIFLVFHDSKDPRYVKLRITEKYKREHDTLSNVEFLNRCFLVSSSSWYKRSEDDPDMHFLEEISREIAYFLQKEEIHGPAHYLKLRNVSLPTVDKTEVFEYPDAWPEPAMNWLIRPRRSGWPSSELIQDIFDSGCHIAPVGKSRSQSELKSDEESPLNESDWRISFTAAENKLGQSLFPVQRHVMILLKIIKKAYLNDHEVISTYHMKNIFFWECENREADFWREDNSAACVMSVLDRLEVCLKRHDLPHYFMPDSNLLQYEEPEKLVTAAEAVLEVRKNILQKTISLLKILQPTMFQSRHYFNDFHNLVEPLLTKIMEDSISQLEVTELMCSLYQLFIDKYKDVIANENLQDYAAESQQIVSALEINLPFVDQLCDVWVKLSEISVDSVNSFLSSIEALPEVKVLKDMLNSKEMKLKGKIIVNWFKADFLKSHWWNIQQAWLADDVYWNIESKVSFVFKFCRCIFEDIIRNVGTKTVMSKPTVMVGKNVLNIVKCIQKCFVSFLKLCYSNISSLRLCVHESLLARTYCKLWFAINRRSSKHCSNRERFACFVTEDIKKYPLDEKFLKLSLVFLDRMLVRGRDSSLIVPEVAAMKTVKHIQETKAAELVGTLKEYHTLIQKLREDSEDYLKEMACMIDDSDDSDDDDNDDDDDDDGGGAGDDDDDVLHRLFFVSDFLKGLIAGFIGMLSVYDDDDNAEVFKEEFEKNFLDGFFHRRR